VETLPEHRGKGYALAAAAAMIHVAVASGLTPVWSCRRENVASVRLAERLGFSVSRVGLYYRLPAAHAA
jgi:predicted GNAT family acetyltransferase